MTFDFTNTYWNNNGEEQTKYNEMEAAGFEYTKTTESTFYRYYRFYNDGDAPAQLRHVMHYSYSYRVQHPEYIAHCQKLEAQVTERIQKEYRRFVAAQQKRA